MSSLDHRFFVEQKSRSCVQSLKITMVDLDADVVALFVFIANSKDKKGVKITTKRTGSANSMVGHSLPVL